jgi:hypothetical protein
MSQRFEEQSSALINQISTLNLGKKQRKPRDLTPEVAKRVQPQRIAKAPIDKTNAKMTNS